MFNALPREVAAPLNMGSLLGTFCSVSPFTYLAEGLLATAVGNSRVQCQDYEFIRFPPPSGTDCREWLSVLQATAAL